MAESRELRRAFFRTIPVYPREIAITEISRKLKLDSRKIYAIISKLPCTMPIAEDEGYLCYPDGNARKLVIRIEASGKDVRRLWT